MVMGRRLLESFLKAKMVTVLGGVLPMGKALHLILIQKEGALSSISQRQMAKMAIQKQSLEVLSLVFRMVFSSLAGSTMVRVGELLKVLKI
ncbi:hypothetical protein ALQ03_103114 [Pseudomonas savastanoi pv. glycinea]|uniref:Uncharacterized protein n=1 Tax=Pseudomonas savastanoi pv. glycinea TaxID=318 RepID=A0A0P9S9Q0_PSESG|nr:hypothetical protein PsgB076_12299 [Pseudomonas savastanoi pv. glycinea str. B076]KPX38690.1 hypothetical protein ALO37_102858 [Pseudomonas savastanoi pv. glycinea]RMO34064.1 hypothetical protein ALQ42_102855 [Pseudomonas savastanoi pv. glycinea]RMP53015.1 hypothetical protein ALQ21_102955 [Pseudomonas savastanoi pv. glycinea]RMP93122.1 hypothetical protein ALQ14_103171 [Pseudomonas savastanoi pv. glycinea]